jgi:Ser/Thr protein kinase RdoA (MazF antagonist)
LELSKERIINILRKYYGFDFSNVLSIEIAKIDEGYMNNCIIIRLLPQNQRLVIIIYNTNRYSEEKSQNRIKNAYMAARVLNRNSIPVRIPLKTATSPPKDFIEINVTDQKTTILGVYNYLPGQTVPWESYTRRHLRAVGLYMRRIHHIWQQEDPNKYPFLPKWTDYIRNDSQKLFKYFKKNQQYIKKKLDIEIDLDFIKTLKKQITNSPLHQPHLNQLVHQDLVRGNILFGSMKKKNIYPIHGIIDFEKILIANPITDLARTLSFLFVDCKYKTIPEIKKYFLDQGYFAFETIHNQKFPNAPKQSKLKQETVTKEKNKKLLTELPPFRHIKHFMLYFWVRDLWKLLSRNPYQDLMHNFHYKQTSNRLHAEKVILTK